MWSHILWFLIMVESSAGSNHLQKFEVRVFFWMVRVGSSLQRFDNKSEVRNGSKISFSGFWPGFGLFPTDLCFKVRDYFCGSSSRFGVRNSEFLGSTHYHHNKLHEYQFFRTHHQTNKKQNFLKIFFCHSQS